jgi:hypothetical protein
VVASVGVLLPALVASEAGVLGKLVTALQTVEELVVAAGILLG